MSNLVIENTHVIANTYSSLKKTYHSRYVFFKYIYVQFNYYAFYSPKNGFIYKCTSTEN